MVERMTDVKGAAAEAQNSFGFLKLCCKFSRIIRT
jgi:hypothetical protein